jgi:hypothetical protein
VIGYERIIDRNIKKDNFMTRGIKTVINTIYNIDFDLAISNKFSDS